MMFTIASRPPIMMVIKVATESNLDEEIGSGQRQAAQSGRVTQVEFEIGAGTLPNRRVKT